MAQPPIINYEAHIIQPGTDLVVTGDGTPNITATYGDYGTNTYATGKKASCTVSVNYTNINWTINGDNSITVTGNINGAALVRTATGLQDNVNQLVKAWFNNGQTFEQLIPTASSGTYNLNIPNSFSVTIAPSNNPQPQYPAAIHFFNQVQVSQGGRDPDEFALGLIITNPNPPSYRAGAIWNGSSWQSHNRSGGWAGIWDGSSFREMRTVNGGTDSDNPPLLRHSSGWKNMRKTGDNS